MDLRLVYVFEEPDPGWSGERGWIDAALLQRHLPADFRHWQFFVTGPAPMMDSLERILPGLGVRPERVRSERFDMV